MRRCWFNLGDAWLAGSFADLVRGWAGYCAAAVALHWNALRALELVCLVFWLNRLVSILEWDGMTTGGGIRSSNAKVGTKIVGTVITYQSVRLLELVDWPGCVVLLRAVVV